MAQGSDRTSRRKTDIKGPLVISVVLAVVAFVVVTIAASGGTAGGARVGLGLIAAGIAFIVSVVVCSTLMLIEKPNDPDLGQGTGVNRSSAKLFAESKARRAAQQRGGASKPSATPEYGQRVHPDTKGEKPGFS